MTAVSKIKLKRMVEGSIPTLDTGEPCWATDTGKLYIGNSGSNTLVGGNSFTTITPSSGDSVEADSGSDTLTLSGTGGITVTGTAATDTIVIDGSGITGYSDEQAQDAVGSIFVDSATIDFTYNDGTPSITGSVIQSGLDHGSIGGLTDDDHTQYIFLTPGSSSRNLIQPSGDFKGLIVKNNASQTANLFELQNSSGTALFLMAADGTVTSQSILPRTNGAYDLGSSSLKWNDIFVVSDGTIAFGDGSSTIGDGGFDGNLYFTCVNTLEFSSTNGPIRFNQKVIPSADSSHDLGAIGGFIDSKWNNAYFGGSIFLRTNTSKYRCGASNQASIGYDGTDLVINSQESGSGSINLSAQSASSITTETLSEYVTIKIGGVSKKIAIVA